MNILVTSGKIYKVAGGCQIMVGLQFVSQACCPTHLRRFMSTVDDLYLYSSLYPKSCVQVFWISEETLRYGTGISVGSTDLQLKGRSDSTRAF